MHGSLQQYGLLYVKHPGSIAGVFNTYELLITIAKLLSVIVLVFVASFMSKKSFFLTHAVIDLVARLPVY